MANEWSLQETCDLIIARHLRMSYWQASFFVKRSRQGCQKRWQKLKFLPCMNVLTDDELYPTLRQMVEQKYSRREISDQTGITNMDTLSGKIHRMKQHYGKQQNADVLY